MWALPSRRPAPRGRAGQRTEPAKNPAPPSPRAVTSVQCSVQLQVSAEPRLGLTQTGPLSITEARDDQGNSLLEGGQAASVVTRNAGYMGMTCSSVVHVRAPLNRPENPGRTIKILRGVIPLRITARQPDPLVIPLASAAGKSFDKGDLHVVVNEIRSDPNNRQRQIELTVRDSRSEAIPAGDEALGSEFRHSHGYATAESRGPRCSRPGPPLVPDECRHGVFPDDLDHGRPRHRRAERASLLPPHLDDGERALHLHRCADAVIWANCAGSC